MRLQWNAARLAAERQRLLRELLLFAADRSAFWRDRLAGRELETFTEADLPSLPVLTRAEMMEEFDRLITVPGLTLDRVKAHLEQLDSDRYLAGEYRAIKTSGATGTEAFHVYGWEAFVTFVMQGSRWTGRRGEAPDAVLAQVFSCSLQHESGIFHAFSSFESGGPPSHCFSGTTPLPELVAGLNAADPAVEALQGWPSIIRQLALEKLAGPAQAGTHLGQCCGRGVYSTGAGSGMGRLGHRAVRVLGLLGGNVRLSVRGRRRDARRGRPGDLGASGCTGKRRAVWAAGGSGAADESLQPGPAADPLRHRGCHDDHRYALSLRLRTSANHRRPGTHGRCFRVSGRGDRSSSRTSNRPCSPGLVWLTSSWASWITVSMWHSWSTVHATVCDCAGSSSICWNSAVLPRPRFRCARSKRLTGCGPARSASSRLFPERTGLSGLATSWSWHPPAGIGVRACPRGASAGWLRCRPTAPQPVRTSRAHRLAPRRC